MRSYISSSNSQTQTGPWLRTLFIGLSLALLILAFIETFWRTLGFAPSVVDDPNLWSYYRKQVHKSGPNTVVLLGSSRMQNDFSLQTFRDMCPGYQIFQLAIPGKPSMATLMDLAQDDTFKGIILSSAKPAWFEPRLWNKQSEYVEYYHKHFTLNMMINRIITSFIQGTFVAINPEVNIRWTIRKFLNSGQLPKPGPLTTYFDRSRSADYTKVDIVEYRKSRIKKLQNAYKKISHIPPPEQWVKHVAEVEPFVNRIHQRGGKIVFLQMPTTGKHLEIDEYYYPKKKYWDKLSSTTSAETIHFQDVPALSNFYCPDTSHLDYRDTPRFTKAVLEELIHRGIINCDFKSTTTP